MSTSYLNSINSKLIISTKSNTHTFLADCVVICHHNTLAVSQDTFNVYKLLNMYHGTSCVHVLYWFVIGQ